MQLNAAGREFVVQAAFLPLIHDAGQVEQLTHSRVFVCNGKIAVGHIRGHTAGHGGQILLIIVVPGMELYGHMDVRMLGVELIDQALYGRLVDVSCTKEHVPVQKLCNLTGRFCLLVRLLCGRGLRGVGGGVLLCGFRRLRGAADECKREHQHAQRKRQKLFQIHNVLSFVVLALKRVLRRSLHIQSIIRHTIREPRKALGDPVKTLYLPCQYCYIFFHGL